MASKLSVLREYAGNELRSNVLRTLYRGTSRFTMIQKRRVFAELLEGECTSIMNYEFEVRDHDVKISCKYRTNTPVVWESVNINHIHSFDLDHEPIIKRIVGRNLEQVCQKVLEDQYPGIEFKKFLERPMECHFKANANPTNYVYYLLP